MLVWIQFGKGKVGFISCAHINPLHEIEVYLISKSVVSVKITPRKSYLKQIWVSENWICRKYPTRKPSVCSSFGRALQLTPPRLRSPVVPSIRPLPLSFYDTSTRKPPFPLQKTTQSNTKTIRPPLENHHFDSKITLRRSKILLSRPQNTTPQTKNTPNPADFPGKTSRLYKWDLRGVILNPIRGWFFSCVYTNAVQEIEVHLISTSVFPVKIAPRNSYIN
ncbi:hypothetical protein SDC9_17447 [bioreactor metagenome]|uniref:Uncharacterized protein n=1 Tax=bioreactor metagenome TaxID=1076179 RepID=A0A644TYF1_9ZZZZ